MLQRKLRKPFCKFIKILYDKISFIYHATVVVTTYFYGIDFTW